MLHRNLLAMFWLMIFGTCFAQQADPALERNILLDQQIALSIQTDLRCSHFPDASCDLANGILTIGYSRSRCRAGAFATRQLAGLLDSLAVSDVDSLVIQVIDRNIPVYKYHYSRPHGRETFVPLKYAIGQDKVSDLASNLGIGTSTNYSFLFSLDPQFRFAFGARPDPFQVQINLIPSLYFRLWQGSQLQIQTIFPIWNELDIPEEDKIRPGLFVFSQNLRLGKGLFSSVSLGYFQSYRYGIRCDFGKYLLNDRLFLGAQIGFTGYASNPKRLGLLNPEPGWQVSDINYIDYRMLMGWRWDPVDVQVLASYGRGLFDQNIITMSVSRQFGLLNIELIGQQLDQKLNYAVRARIPIPFYRKYLGKRVGLQSGSYLNFRYNGTQNYENDYDAGHDFPYLIKQLHPGLIFANQ